VIGSKGVGKSTFIENLLYEGNQKELIPLSNEKQSIVINHELGSYLVIREFSEQDIQEISYQ